MLEAIDTWENEGGALPGGRMADSGVDACARVPPTTAGDAVKDPASWVGPESVSETSS